MHILSARDGKCNENPSKFAFCERLLHKTQSNILLFLYGVCVSSSRLRKREIKINRMHRYHLISLFAGKFTGNCELFNVLTLIYSVNEWRKKIRGNFAKMRRTCHWSCTPMTNRKLCVRRNEKDLPRLHTLEMHHIRGAKGKNLLSTQFITFFSQFFFNPWSVQMDKRNGQPEKMPQKQRKRHMQTNTFSVCLLFYGAHNTHWPLVLAKTKTAAHHISASCFISYRLERRKSHRFEWWSNENSGSI